MKKMFFIIGMPIVTALRVHADEAQNGFKFTTFQQGAA